MRLSKKYPQILLIGTGIAFIASGMDCLENSLLFIAISSFIVGALNIAASLFVTRHPFMIKIFLLFINAVFAFLSSYAFFIAGKDKIQYAWAVVGVVNLIAIIIAYIKRAKKRIKLKEEQ